MTATTPLQPAPRGAATEGESRPLPAASIVELILERARQTPDSVALEHRGSTLTFGQLADRAAATVAALAELGVGAGHRVALWADRTPATIAAALGVMQLRAAYVPIDATYPADRARAILAGSDPTAILHDGEMSAPPPSSDLPSIDLSALPSPGASWRPPSPRAGDAAYVVFTSGSSGPPKGVVVEHRSLVNYVAWCTDLVGSDGCGAPLFASLGFDHAITCLWVPLAQGQPVVVVPGLWDHEPLFGDGANRYDFLKITPSHVRFFERLLRPDYAATTRLLMFGGEALDADLVRQLGERAEGIRLVNHYGPTEATVGCCSWEFAAATLDDSAAVPIGRPIWNSRAYVVDENLRPVAAGEEGELVMAGACVARGYLDGEAGGFIDESLVGGPSGPAYRTGDVVRELPGGALRFVGRNDSQLKVSGHRIELEELRRCALAVPGVAEAGFDVRGDELDRVEVFVVPTDGEASSERLADDVRAAMARALPPAVVPKAVFVVHELVLNAHGKFDMGATRALQAGAAQ